MTDHPFSGLFGEEKHRGAKPSSTRTEVARLCVLLARLSGTEQTKHGML